MPLFGRKAVVLIDNLRVEGLDVRFKIEADAKTFGKSEIQIYNLNSVHRGELENSKTPEVSLFVQYTDQPEDLLFKGTLRDVFSSWDKPDWITTLRTGDGDKAKQARLNRAYSAGTAWEKVWKDLVDSMSGLIDPGNAIEAFRQGSFKDGITQLLHGGNVQGESFKNLQRLAHSAGLDITTEDNALLVTVKNQPLDQTAVVIGPKSGLIGSPQRGTKGEVRARCLILPGLRPKRKVQIESRLINGTFAVQKANYTGDTSGNDWYVDLECVEF